MPNVRPLSEAFTARLVGQSWNTYKESLGLPPYLGRSYFGTNKQRSLDLGFIKGQKGLPVALKASAFDAQAPLRDGITFKTIQNEMPFFRESFMISERQRKDYDTFLNSTNIEDAESVLNRIIVQPLDLIKGANVVPERMIWQLMAPADGIPRIKVAIDGDATNKAYYVDYTSDSGSAYKTTNFMEIRTDSSKWSAPSTATPIADLVSAKRQHRNNTGEVLSTFIMNDTTWQAFCSAVDTKKQVVGATAYSNGQVPTEEQTKAFMREAYRINILVYGSMYMDESGVSKTFIPDYIVTALPSNITTLGTVWYSTTPEEDSGNTDVGDLAIVETGVAVYSYVKPHPVQYHCVVSEIVLPSYENMDSVFVMKVGGVNL